MSKMTIPMKFEMTNEVLNENFHKVKLYVCHNGQNFNGSTFSDLAIAKASKTLQNIPILAYIERDEDGNALGFGGHEVEYKLEEKDGEIYFKEHYLEVPIGVIPQQNDYSIETIDGRNYVVCSGYIWKCYSNEAIDLLLENQEQSVSMEISVNDGKLLKDGIYDILDYEYLGVTVIGVEPAMENAKILMSFTANDNYRKTVEDLNILLQNFNKKGGEKNMEEENKIIEQEVEEPQQEEFAEDDAVEIPVIVEEQEEMACGNKKKKRCAEDEEDVCPNCGKPMSECECDEEDMACGNKKKKKCSEEEQEEMACGNKKKKKCSEDEEEKEEEKDEEEMACGNKKKKKCSCEEEQEVEEKLYSQAELDEAIANAKAEFSDALVELAELREFKAEYDRQVELAKLNESMDELVANFNVDGEKVNELREKVISGDYSLEKFELELYRNHQPIAKKDFSKEDKKTLPIVDVEDKKSEVDKLFDYYGIPKRDK